MIKKLGVVVDTTNISQSLDYIINSLNYISSNTNIDCCIFRCNINRLIAVPKFAIMNLDHLWAFDGIAIATSLFTAKKLLACPRPIIKYLYLSNLEWYYYNTKYSELANIYQNLELNLITRCAMHQKLVNQCWNRNSTIITDFNPKLIIEGIKNDYKYISS